MRTAGFVGMVDGSVQVRGLDMFADGDAAIIMEAVVPEIPTEIHCVSEAT